MIIYFTDRDLNLTGLASTSLPRGLRLFDDLTTEETETGVNTFSCRIAYNDASRQELEDAVKVGRFILKGSGTAFDEKENQYDSLYTIIETEFDTEAQELYIYCEDAGLDLINKVVPEATLTNKTIVEMLNAFLPAGWTVNNIDAPTGTKTYTWEGENTATERVNSVAGLFGCEVYYSFEIERFTITKKIINVTKKRGNQTATLQLRLNSDIFRIVTKTSIADLATAFEVTGGTPEGKETPINLKGYSYSYTDPETGDVYSVDSTTGQMRNTSAMKRWASALDSDGLLVKQYSFDTTDKAVLAGEARAELQKASKEIVNYEVDFADLHDASVGDRIFIIDDDGGLYLDARILHLETSVANMTQTATIGDFLIRDAGIADKVFELAQKFAAQEQLQPTTTLQITTTKGEALPNRDTEVIMQIAIIHSLKTITNITELREIFGTAARLIWYKNGVPTNEGVTDNGFMMIVTSLTEDKVVYRCALEVV